MHPDLVYQLALTLVPNIGCVQANALIHQFGDAASVFKAPKSLLEKTEGIGSVRAHCIKTFHDFNAAEKEIIFIEKYGILPLFITDPLYPKRLLHCYDAPSMLYYRGNADLNQARILSVIGTRSFTDYGKSITEQLIRDLAVFDILIVSGLAFGIDGIAHKTALKHQVPTVAVMAHGLNKMYPPEHSGLAREMIRHGGLLTEFRSNTKPEKHHFPIRNRIVAGMADASIIIETGAKGGSMITADLANGYNKEVFALPGKITDPKSAGCHELIRKNKAILLTGAEQLAEAMGWDQKLMTHKRSASQQELFAGFTENEKTIVSILTEKKIVQIDELQLKSGMSSGAIAAAVLNLEMMGVISLLPGKSYALSNG